MKAIICAIALFSTANAFADIWEPGMGMTEGYGDVPVTHVVCRDTRGHRDDGMTIVVQSGGFIGMTTAVVSRMTIAGSQPVGTIPVDRKEDPTGHPGLVAYNGETFRLVINTQDVRDGRFVPARLKAEIDGHKLAEDLLCKIKN